MASLLTSNASGDSKLRETIKFKATLFKYNKQMQKLQRENEQLRRELEEANNRIHELEQSHHSFACIIPDSSYDDDSDNFSVEIQSVSSSVTTAQAGNLQHKEDKENLLSDDDTIHRSLTPLASGSRRRFDQLSRLSPTLHFEQDLRYLSRSDSNSCTSATSSQTVCSSASSDDGLPSYTTHQNRNKVSTYAMKYLLRTNSSDSTDSNPSILSGYRRVEI